MHVYDTMHSVSHAHRHIFLTTARLIKCSHTTEELETASSSLRCSYIVKLSHQYVFIYCRVATWALLCCIPQWSQRWNNPKMVVGETSWPFADLRMYILHILMYFFSTRLLTEIWAAQDCKSRIILRWIKKTFHYHNPVDLLVPSLCWYESALQYTERMSNAERVYKSKVHCWALHPCEWVTWCFVSLLCSANARKEEES